MELNLISPTKKEFDIDGIEVTLNLITPFVQAELMTEMSDITASEILSQVDTVSFIFSKVVNNIKYKDIDYSGKDFFNMLSLTDENTQIFIAGVIENIVNEVFIGEKESKK